MAVALAIVGVAFAAFCVWLTVRIVNRRERWAKWTLAGIVGLPVLYVASFGPACWITGWFGFHGKWLVTVYGPLIWPMNDGPRVVSNAVASYSLFGAPDGWGWEISAAGRFIDFVPLR